MKWKPRHNITHHFSVALQFEMHLSWVRISKRLQSCVLLGPSSIRPSNTFSQTISFCISDKIHLCYTLLQHCMYHVTKLQKLSKCEVKAWLCRNLIIWLPFRFYVKSKLGEFKQSKNVIFGNFGHSDLWILINLGPESCANLLKTKFRPSEIAKNDIFGLFEICRNLISCKIWVAVKLSNFIKVNP